MPLADSVQRDIGAPASSNAELMPRRVPCSQPHRAAGENQPPASSRSNPPPDSRAQLIPFGRQRKTGFEAGANSSRRIDRRIAADLHGEQIESSRVGCGIAGVQRLARGDPRPEDEVKEGEGLGLMFRVGRGRPVVFPDL